MYPNKNLLFTEGSVEKFDPAKGSLLGYLYLDAARDLLNWLARQKKVVELQAAAPEYEMPDEAADNPEARLIEQASPLVRRALARVTNPLDRELLALLLDGTRETAAYAAVLGIADRPPREQAELVKRHKDRLKKFLQRELGRYHRH